jgi:dTDP-4-amino-4,6-dideoxygalactose transaminase
MSVSRLRERRKVPFMDLLRQYESIRNEVDPVLCEVARSGRYILGPNVEAFEREFASYCCTKHAVGVASGAEALRLALLAIGVGPGDEVITVTNTFVATVDAIIHAGARPVLVDVDPKTFNMDPKSVERAISNRTRGIIAVHLFGNPAEIDTISEIASKHDLYLIEDAAQAHGATYKGRKVGALGHCACFSFYPTKNLGAMGDAGMITTDDDELEEKLRLLGNYGQRKKYQHEIIGYNSRIDEIQAAILRVKLRHLDDWVERRGATAEEYKQKLSGIGVIGFQMTTPKAKHAYHLFVGVFPMRDKLRATLSAKGIETAVHYPRPIHCLEPYVKYARGERFDSANHLAGRILSLPMFPELTTQELELVTTSIIEFYRDEA